MNTVTTTIETATPVALTRKSNDWTTPEALRGLLKQTLGLNARQVSVKTGSSNRYLTVTVRDAGVDFAKVHAFAKGFNTFSVDETDYASGQSITVEATKEVVAAKAAPFLDAVRAAVAEFDARKLGANQGVTVEGTDYVLWLDNHGYWFHVAHRDLVGARGSECPASDARAGEAYAIERLAADIAFRAALRAI